MAERPDWALLFDDFVTQTDPAAFKVRLEPLETAIYFRMQELAASPDSQVELSAIDAACRKILEIKNGKLGFPPAGLG
jgi:hypothetical protein